MFNHLSCIFSSSSCWTTLCRHRQRHPRGRHHLHQRQHPHQDVRPRQEQGGGPQVRRGGRPQHRGDRGDRLQDRRGEVDRAREGRREHRHHPEGDQEAGRHVPGARFKTLKIITKILMELQFEKETCITTDFFRFLDFFIVSF